MKTQSEICREKNPGIVVTTCGCMKDGKYFWYGPGCKNAFGTCPIYEELVGKNKS